MSNNVKDPYASKPWLKFYDENVPHEVDPPIIPIFKFLDDAAKHGAHGCNYLLTSDMEMEPVPGYKYANWELGYGDFHLIPDLATLRLASWLEKTAMVVCDVKEEESDHLVSVAPRTILRRQIENANKLN